MEIICKEPIKKENFFVHRIQGLREVEELLYQEISDASGLTHEICVNLIESGGKRLRPLLVLCGAQCFGPLKIDAIQTGVAYELIHMASLVHDDIIDRSDKRRNQPTVNAKMGNQVSVLVGDYLFAKSFEILSKNRLVESMGIVVHAIHQMCDGEIEQAKNKFNLNQTVDDYYERIYKKTGILISACCKAGAIIGGASEIEIKSLESYGKNLGYAFQIIDDLLDFVGDEKILGKPVGSDLQEGNITLPILKLIEQKEYRDWMKKIFKDEDVMDYKNEIVKILQDHYKLEESFYEAKLCVERAKRSLEPIENSDFKELLIHIADKVLTRKN